MEAVEFYNHLGESLSGSLHRPKEPNGRGVAMGHCFTCSRHTRILADLAAALESLGYLVLRFDFSGNGKSAGDFSESTYSKQAGELSAALLLLGGLGAESLFTAGHSMGGAAALINAATRPGLSGVIAMGAGPQNLSPERLLDEKQREILDLRGEAGFVLRGRSLVVTREFFEDAKKYDLAEIIPSIACPVLLIHGEKDEITRPIGPDFPAKKAPGLEFYQVPGADHMFSTQDARTLVVRKAVSWLSAIS